MTLPPLRSELGSCGPNGEKINLISIQEVDKVLVRLPGLYLLFQQPSSKSKSTPKALFLLEKGRQADRDMSRG